MKIRIFDEKNSLLCERNMAEKPEVAFNKVHANADLLKRAGKRITFKFDLPIIDFAGAWCNKNSYYRPLCKLEWTYKLESAIQSGMPLLTFFRLDQTNAATVALSCPCDDTVIAAQQNQQRYVYEFSVTVEIAPETKPLDLLYSCAPKRWDLVVADWRSLFLGKKGVPQFPAAAFEPVYCSWYAVHGAITPEYLDSNAEIAAELGFRTFILDDGWSYEEMKRVCPEKLAEGWYRDIGNWTVSEKKLPCFKKHVEYAQSLGLKYLLWVSPFFAGTCSNEFKKAKKTDIALHDWSDVAILNPGSKPAQHAIDLLGNLMKDWGLDGLKVDFLDTVPGHSRACQQYFEKLSKTIRTHKKDALIEFRASYATPQMLPYGTQFRACDVPFDWLENIHRIAQIRVSVGDCVPCHADPIYFHPAEKPENIARHMIAAIAGVPMLSMELRDLTPEQYRIIKFWLDFYRAHLDLFSFGHWNVVHRMDTLSYLTVENESAAVIILLDEGKLDELLTNFRGKHIYVLNLTPCELPGGKAYACDGTGLRKKSAPPAGLLEF